MLALQRHEDAKVTAADEKRTLVVGLGATGLATACYLAARGEKVRIVDSREHPPGLDALRRAHPEIEIVLGSLEPRWLDNVIEVVISPGLAVDIPLAAAARQRGIAVVSDIELFARAARAPILAVTGSNGKSTVTMLLASMLEASGLKTAVGGNLGPPALELLAIGGVEAYVLEISSFQMESTEHLRPRAAAVLNVTADHLDRHGSLERYAALKAKLLRCAERAVYNWDDPGVRAMGLAHPEGVPFSIEAALTRGFSVVEQRGERWLARDLEPLLATRALRLRGAHNEANALAALALAEALGGPREPQLAALQTFAGLEHRCEFVAEVGGVDYINDSKGTNVGATLAALRGLAAPLVLIAGGVGKGQDFAPLAAAARGKVKHALLIGQAAPALAEALRGVCPSECAATMTEAVEAARRRAERGDTVLLSPACASQDMFADYRERGEAFMAAVRELEP
jgi:UDP-N-acetylmuramoylalanine--D-glutamate ligase